MFEPSSATCAIKSQGNYLVSLCLSSIMQKVRRETILAHTVVGGLNTSIHAICLEQCLNNHKQLLPAWASGKQSKVLFFLHWLVIRSEGHCFICNTFFTLSLRTWGCAFHLLCTDYFKHCSQIGFSPSHFIGIPGD